MEPHTPTIYQNRVTALSHDGFWILDSLPWQLRKSFPLYKRASFMLSKSILLAICRVPDPVYKEIGNEEQDESKAIPAVYRRGMICQVKCTVAVT